LEHAIFFLGVARSREGQEGLSAHGEKGIDRNKMKMYHYICVHLSGVLGDENKMKKIYLKG
jgi:hypothetical protein